MAGVRIAVVINIGITAIADVHWRRWSWRFHQPRHLADRFAAAHHRRARREPARDRRRLFAALGPAPADTRRHPHAAAVDASPRPGQDGTRMIKLENLTKAFETPSGTVIAADRINMDVADGEICVLLGPSGCGKTTTLKMINRLVEPTSGKIYIDGKDTDAVRSGRAAAHDRLRDPADRPLPEHDGRGQRLRRAEAARLGHGEARASGQASSLRRSTSTRRSSSSAIRRNCRAASSSASASRARSPPIRRCC